jgi:hypothetical protein
VVHFEVIRDTMSLCSALVITAFALPSSAHAAIGIRAAPAIANILVYFMVVFLQISKRTPKSSYA